MSGNSCGDVDIRNLSLAEDKQKSSAKDILEEFGGRLDGGGVSAS
jgi:hypothetical protein